MGAKKEAPKKADKEKIKAAAAKKTGAAKDEDYVEIECKVKIKSKIFFKWNEWLERKNFRFPYLLPALSSKARYLPKRQKQTANGSICSRF